MTEALVPERRILGAVVGSHAYGTATSESDLDTMEVYLGHENSYIGLDWWGNQGTREYRTPEGETTAYELRKFLRLCQNFNPNVVPLLWLKDTTYFCATPEGRELLAARDLFSSRAAYHSFAGYAHGQLRKMGEPGASTGKMGEARKALRERFGYDTKYAYHTIRLGTMLTEFLEDGILRVCRTEDREELLAIRNGRYKYEEVLERSTALLEEAKLKLVKSPLPEGPDKEGIRKLCRKLVREHLKLR